MAIRYEFGETAQTNDGFVKEATIYATTATEAKGISTAGLSMGSILIIVNTSAVYMLNADGGEWRSVSNGDPL